MPGRAKKLRSIDAASGVGTGYDRRRADDRVVEPGRGEGEGRDLEVLAEAGQRPQEDEDRGQGEGRPALEHRPEAVRAQLDRALPLPVLHQPARLPEAQERHHHQQREDGGHDVDEARLLVVGPVELHGRERRAAHQQRGQHLERPLPADHRDDEPGGQDEGEGRQDPPHHRVELVDGQAGHPVQHADGVADAAPGHRRGVGEEAQGRRLEVREAEADQEGPRDRHRRPAAAVPSRKAPKQKAIRMTCRRRSEETPAIDSFITWNCPVSTATL